jgi:hypothetical protein
MISFIIRGVAILLPQLEEKLKELPCVVGNIINNPNKKNNVT